MFVSAVAKYRNTTVRTVINGFGKGRVVGAEQAVTLGMADQVASFDQTAKRLRQQQREVALAQKTDLARRYRRLNGYHKNQPPEF
jgi:ClpP class serine protease